VQTYHDLASTPPLERAITVGVFDGVHRGHRVLLSRLMGEARARNLAATVITFSNHPHSVLNPPAPPLLTTIDERLDLLGELGVDEVVTLTFTQELSRMTAEVFCQEILVSKLGCKLLVVGDDFALGYRREGTASKLTQLGEEMGFEVVTVPSATFAGIRVSSSEIRQMLLEGEVEKANEFLGKPYRLKGVVQKGLGRGQRLGFPTINLKVPQEKLLPRFGVYAGKVFVMGETWDAATYIGQRLTFGETEVAVEAHLLGFNGSVPQGTTATLELLAFVRSDQKFESVEALTAQMNHDVEVVKERIKGIAQSN